MRLKCPNCGNENPNQFMPTKMAYMSAFNVDNDAYRCKVCGKDFYIDPILEPVDIFVTKGITQGSTRAKGGLFVPTFPSYSLPPLDPTKATAIANKKADFDAKEIKVNDFERDSEIERKQEHKLKEAMEWAEKQKFKSTKRSNELSEFNPYKKKRMMDEL